MALVSGPGAMDSWWSTPRADDCDDVGCPGYVRGEHRGGAVEEHKT